MSDAELKQLADTVAAQLRATVTPNLPATVPIVAPHENTKTDIASYLSSGLMQVITLAALAYLGAKTPPTPAPVPPVPVVENTVQTKLVTDVADLQARVKVLEAVPTPVKPK